MSNANPEMLHTQISTLTNLLDLTRFVRECQEIINVSYGDRAPTLIVETGKKYYKLVKSEPYMRLVYGFVEIATGDVYKAASWQAPAKHVRGNVKAAASLCAGPYGIVYLR
jgi:hypothetical protein